MMPEISVIIPTLNEGKHIQSLIRRIYDSSSAVECIVVDGGSTDNTVQLAKKLGATVSETNRANRAIQLNRGAAFAKAPVLYFIHADTLPPANFSTLLLQSIGEGYQFGCFRFRFNSHKKHLKINSFFTRFPLMIFRGGDQSLFITRKLFDQLNGYDDSMRVMEDYDIIARAKKLSKLKIIQEDILVSDRKYEDNSYFRVNAANLIIFTSYYLGVSTERLGRWYGKLIKHPKTTKTGQRPVSAEVEVDKPTFARAFEPDNKFG